MKEIELDGYLPGAYQNLSEIYYATNAYDKLDQLLSQKSARKYIPLNIQRYYYFKTGQLFNYLKQIYNFRSFDSISFIAACLVTVLWLQYLRRLDPFEPEKIRWLILTLLLGMLAANATFIIQDTLGLFVSLTPTGKLLDDVLFYVFQVAVVEEVVKLIAFYLILKYTSQVNESVDYVVYAAVSALGFSLMENALYFDTFTTRVMAIRAFTSVVLHMGATVIAVSGLLHSRYSICGVGKIWGFAGTFTAAVLLHGFYDLFLCNDTIIYSRLYSIVIFVVTVIYFAKVIAFALAQSEFRLARVRSVSNFNFLVYGMFAVINLQYIVTVYRFGTTYGASCISYQMPIYIILIIVLAARLGNIETAKKELS